MKEYATKDIANIVGIATPTVRKYAQILEKNGYYFTKNEKGNRIFIDSDIEIFQEIKDRSNDMGMNVDNIVKILINERKSNIDESIQNESHSTTLKQNDDELPDTMQNDERYDTLLNEIQELKEMIIQQQTYFDKKLEARDKLLMESIRAIQEQEQAQIETAPSKEREKGFFSKMFGKNSR